MTTTQSAIFHRPTRILASILALVFAAEVGVMFALPYLMPARISEAGRAIMDAVLLTTLCAPALWWVIIGPLRRIALQAHERSETIVANACDGILTVDRLGIIVSCNPAGRRMLDPADRDLIGGSIQAIIPQWPVQFTNLPAKLELEVVRADGVRCPLEVSVSEFLNATPGKLIVIVRDLTLAKQAEQERLNLVRQTEALRAQQMATLAQMATGVAHEIRNPLTSIKMLIQVNRASFAEAGLPTDDLELVEQEIRRMERSINSLLDYARPERGECKRVNLGELVRRTVQLIQGQCKAQNIQIHADIPDETAMIDGDSAQIHQLLLNLCLNAMESMKAGGDLRVVIRCRGGEVIVSVADSGEGICPEVRDRIFDPFVTTKSNGIGLGLGICRRIAESHRGTLEGGNRERGGAEFRLKLPIASEQPDCGNHSLSSEVSCKSY